MKSESPRRAAGALVGAFLLVIALSGCGEKTQAGAKAKEPPASASSKPSSGNPLTAPVDYLGAVGAAQKQAAKTVDLVTLNQAVQAFRAGEERLPSSLQELVSEGYLPRLPDVPRGMRVVYDAHSGTVKIVRAPPAGQ